MDKPIIHFDKRIADRSIRKGLLSQDEYDSFMHSLPDREQDAEILNLEEEEEAAAAERPGTGAPAGEPRPEAAPFAALEGPSEAPHAEQEPVDTPGEND